jgi:predicted alpha/beta-fold hydrolase
LAGGHGGCVAAPRSAGLLAASRDEIVSIAARESVCSAISSAPLGEPRGLAVLLHGWEGSAGANYVVSVGGLLHDAGFAVFRLNFRDQATRSR